MMMRHCLVRAIRVHLRKSLPEKPAKPQPHGWRLVWRREPSVSRLIAAATVALVIAIGGLRAASDPLTDLKAGADAIDARRYAAAISTLQPLAKRIPKLADYAAWLLASAEFEAQDYAAVEKSLEPVWSQSPASPLFPRAVVLGASAYEQSGQTQKAVDILRAHYSGLTQPEGDLAMATAFEESGDRVSAAVYFQRVYYGYPVSAEAATAEAEIAKLRAQLGDAYPPAMPDAMLGRAFKLLNAGSNARAKKELESILADLGGAERDLARVRIGVADYNQKETLAAQKYFESLEITSPEADAERLSYLVECARRLKNHEAVHALLDKLAREYPQSKWRLEALVSDANFHLIENTLDSYEPQYRACYESFPGDAQAAPCHWKIVWAHYLRRRADAADLLRAHVRLFPGSEDTPAALYFLGRIAEEAKDAGSARAYYDEIAHQYPNFYYTVLARERLKQVSAPPSAAVNQFLHGIPFPPRLRTLSFVPDQTAQARLDRARMLAKAGMDDWAEFELRFAAQNENQPQVMALELASIASRRGETDRALGLIKRYASGYLMMPLESAPAEFWKLAFPLPYRADLERFAKQNGLDPFLVAALIRQESEFNPKAVSPANARGLMQIEPSTGRELSRRLKMKPYTTARLFQPAVSLEFGSFYFKSMMDSLGGRFEAALAAYNAGLSRARAWSSWGEYREPAEFIETVPFSQTRNYIQTVLRNADVYRRLYGGSLPAERAALQ
jgi:soluble lytic murein transglycosylase